MAESETTAGAIISIQFIISGVILHELPGQYGANESEDPADCTGDGGHFPLKGVDLCLDRRHPVIDFI